MTRARPRGLVLFAAAVLACAATLEATSALAAPEPTPSSEVLFDDFQYTDSHDARLERHGWAVRPSGAGGPSASWGTWSPDRVSFPAEDSSATDQVMQLRATTDGTSAGTTKSQVQTTADKFYNGTYAARVFFTDDPTPKVADKDLSVQTFYTISTPDRIRPDNAFYSELDYEYLPNGGWDDGPESRLYRTAWNHSENTPGAKNSANTVTSMQGWHTLVLTVNDGAVRFYVDGREQPGNPSWQYAPREPMTINFNNWFIEPDVKPARGPARDWDMRVDWVYHNTNGSLTTEQITAAVEGYAKTGVSFIDTVPTIDTRPRKAPHDYNGDRISDIALFYDYGAASRTCRHTAIFALPGRSDNSGNVGGLSKAWDGSCEPARPKFFTTGDYTGDGRSDVAAFYDYGPGGPSCPASNRVELFMWTADSVGALSGPRSVWQNPCFGGDSAFMDSGDFDGDGKSDIALLHHHGAGHMELFTLTADPNGSGRFGGHASRWNQPNWGADVRFLTTGDYNGDGKSDIALFYDYGNAGADPACPDSHQAVFVLTADSAGSGALSVPVKSWESSCFGKDTAFVDSGDFDGDGKSDIALLYHYGAGQARLFTLTANDGGGLDGLARRWFWNRGGVDLRSLTTGDYNGDGKDDIALLYDGSRGAGCGGQSIQQVRTLLANHYGSGAFTGDPVGAEISGEPEVAWESSCFGSGTISMN